MADGSECTIDASALTGASGKKIIVTGTTGDEKLIVDYINGVFTAATAVSTLTGGISLKSVIQADMGTGTGDHVKFRGTIYNDNLLFGTTGLYSYLIVKAGAVATPTPLTAAGTFHDVTMLGAEYVTVSAGPGYDQISGLGLAGTTTAANNANELAGTISFTVYGGTEGDIITSGNLSSGGAYNSLNGDAGDDRFIQQVKKAADVIVGGDGTDSIDYSSRSAGVTVTLGGSPATAASGTVTVVDKASLVTNDYFALDDGNGAVEFVYQVLPDGPATGSITIDDYEEFVNGDTITLDDGTQAATVLCFDTTGAYNCGVEVPGSVEVDISADSSNAEVATRLAGVINGVVGGLLITATPALAVVGLENDSDGADGNVPITSSLSGAPVTIDGMDGGALLVAKDVTIDLTSANISNAIEVADATAAAINGAGMTLLATVDNDVIDVVNTVKGAAGNNVAVADNVADAGFIVSDMTGGADLGSTADDGESGETDDIDATVENVLGSTGADTIDASEATGVAHILVGLAGNDTITGADDADTIYGGTGDDTLKGGAAADSIYGGAGNNVLQGGLGDDTINGAGNNCPATWNGVALSTTLCPAAGATGVNTIDFSDRVVGEDVTCDLSASEPQVCGDGAELETWSNIKNIRGGAGDDVLTGDANDNTIWGGLGADTIKGGAGNDTLYGEDGADDIDGEAGNDFVSGGTGYDVLEGGAGNDFVDADDGQKDQTISCGPTTEADIGITDSRDPAKTHCQL